MEQHRSYWAMVTFDTCFICSVVVLPCPSFIFLMIFFIQTPLTEVFSQDTGYLWKYFVGQWQFSMASSSHYDYKTSFGMDWTRPGAKCNSQGYDLRRGITQNHWFHTTNFHRWDKLTSSIQFNFCSALFCSKYPRRVTAKTHLEKDNFLFLKFKSFTTYEHHVLPHKVSTSVCFIVFCISGIEWLYY